MFTVGVWIQRLSDINISQQSFYPGTLGWVSLASSTGRELSGNIVSGSLVSGKYEYVRACMYVYACVRRPRSRSAVRTEAVFYEAALHRADPFLNIEVSQT